MNVKMFTHRGAQTTIAASPMPFFMTSMILYIGASVLSPPPAPDRVASTGRQPSPAWGTRRLPGAHTRGSTEPWRCTPVEYEMEFTRNSPLLAVGLRTTPKCGFTRTILKSNNENLKLGISTSGCFHRFKPPDI